MSLMRRIIEGRVIWTGLTMQQIAGPNDACDLYLYHDDDAWVCDRCPLGPNVERVDRYPSVYMLTNIELLAHLHRHRQAGHRFPRWAERAIAEEVT